MPSLNNLFDRFIKERIYGKNITPKTKRAHEQAWRSFTRYCPQILEADQLGKHVLIDYLEALHKSGIRATSVNCYARSLNAFFKWLNDERYVEAEAGRELKIKKLAVPKEVIKTLPDETLGKLLDYKPKDRTERRVWMLVLTILDTGIRITEAFGLRVPEVDFENKLLRVVGKGRKERLVPFSERIRKHLYKFINSKDHDKLPQDHYVFCTRDGEQLRYDNIRRDYINLCTKLKVEKLGGFHRMRHTFASNFIKKRGGVTDLKHILGHEELRTTEIYVHTDIESLQQAHASTSVWDGVEKKGRK
jgi:site-specific recombinase XerD